VTNTMSASGFCVDPVQTFLISYLEYSRRPVQNAVKPKDLF
jgi:hypothetical protein